MSRPGQFNPLFRRSQRGSWSLFVCLMSLAACGYLGIELQDTSAPIDDPNDPMGDLDGSIGADGSTGNGNSDGGDGTADGGAYPGPVGAPEEIEICIGSVCSSSVDRCPDDAAKLWPGVCGCGVPDVDQDDDGTPDCIDLCPGAPDKLASGTCGCEAAQADNDGDGVPNCFDYCPADQDKNGPGVCGCGENDDDDLDDDGMPDCADECTEDPLKVSAGLCGCGLEDSEIDSDEDGIPDCTDTCGGLDDSKYVPDASCGQGYCRTHNTPSSCEDGEETACEAAPPLAANDATCDGVDDDCDGNVDQDYVPTQTQTTCGSGVCQRFAEMRCTNGAMVEVCQAGSGSANDRTCDGVDDDCNGQTDDGYQVTPTSCGTGACASTGSLMCTAGETVDTCKAGTAAPNDSVCNGVDDDCDGNVDEEYVPTQTSTTCGSGACQRFGTRQCVNGSLVEECKAGSSAASDATCDGVDDDCDGLVDEDYVPTATSCGVGACGRTGSLTCQNGKVVDTCAPGPKAPSDQSCNNTDDDCDGSVDEDFVVTATSCGVGACGRTGSLTCQNGVQVNSCTPGAPAANDQSCNNIDDDCNGQVDEDYVVTATSCGVGACGRTGSRSCQNGAQVDSCAPGAPAASDASCNNIDDDCNGQVDEDYVVTATNCGVGACGRMGSLTCQNGAQVNSCTPGAPAANDASCNNIDDDCNGQVDEDYVVTATNCGVGACGSTGNLSCQNGAQVNSCTPGAPAANDASCNNIDDDCNGQVDEDYVPDASCGVGYCRTTNTPSMCVNGVVSACVPGTKLANNDTTADGVDDDCDGSVDEDACVSSTLTYGAGQQTLTPPPGCTTMTVKLWGGGGAAGSGSRQGRGGAGGYAQSTLTISGALQVLVGNGGSGCTGGGSNPGAATYNGGAGGSDGFASTAGSPGAEGTVTGGGLGATDSGGKNGGRGNFGGGGGGGGASAPWPPYAEAGGGGGAASVVLMGGTRVMLAGGGGGGGGSTGTGAVPTGSAGVGGEGCGGAGGNGNGGGGGGGGGACTGTVTTQGTNGVPASGAPAAQARGGQNACSAGGGGYAIITWGP